MPPMISSTRLVQESTRTTSSPHTKYLTGQVPSTTMMSGCKSLSTTVPGRATPTETETLLFSIRCTEGLCSANLGNLLGLEAGARASLVSGFSPASAARSTLALGFGLALSGDSVGPSNGPRPMTAGGAEQARQGAPPWRTACSVWWLP